MATPGNVSEALQNRPVTGTQKVTVESLLDRTDVKARFTSMMKDRAQGFMSSIISAMSLNTDLKICEPITVVSAAAIAASLDLPINPNLGFAAIVPYKGKATFQMMVKGFVQLAMRSGQYRTLNCTEIYDGELVEEDRFTGDMKFDATKRKPNAKVVGFLAYEKLLNGFEKYFYMTMEECMAHGKKYSKSFDRGLWGEVKNGNYAMPLKTVVKLMLSKYGVLSIEMQKAITFDQAAVNQDETPEYVDSPGGEIDEANIVTDAALPAPQTESLQPSPADEEVAKELKTYEGFKRDLAVKQPLKKLQELFALIQKAHDEGALNEAHFVDLTQLHDSLTPKENPNS